MPCGHRRSRDAVRVALERVTGRGARITLVGFKKDHASSYLDAFPGWTVHEVAPRVDISASDLRRVDFQIPSIPAVRELGEESGCKPHPTQLRLYPTD